MVISPGFRALIPYLLVINSLVGLIRIYSSFTFPNLQMKDFIQEFLMAKALLNGEGMYESIPELSRRWIGDELVTTLNHPTPHPPVLGILSLPFGFVSYKVSAILWLIIEIICLYAIVWRMLEWWDGKRSVRKCVLIVLAALGWMPLIEELWLGQIGTLLLLLLLSAWMKFETRRDACGGCLLGIAIAIKIFAWPVVAFLLLYRRWKAALSALAAIVTINMCALLILGKDQFLYYYQHVAPSIGMLYRSHDCNYSTWTLGKRVFGEYGRYFASAPLLFSPSGEKVVTYLLPILVLLSGLGIVAIMKKFENAFGAVLLISILVSPIAWTHYNLLAIIPLAIVAKWYSAAGWPKAKSYKLILSFALLSVFSGAYQTMAIWFSTGRTATGLLLVPFWATQITFLPVAGIVLLFYLIWEKDVDESGQDPTLQTFRTINYKLRSLAEN